MTHTDVSRLILVAMLESTNQMVTSQSVRRRLNVVTGVVLFIVAGLILIM